MGEEYEIKEAGLGDRGRVILWESVNLGISRSTG